MSLRHIDVYSTVHFCIWIIRILFEIDHNWVILRYIYFQCLEKKIVQINVTITPNNTMILSTDKNSKKKLSKFVYLISVPAEITNICLHLVLIEWKCCKKIPFFQMLMNLEQFQNDNLFAIRIKLDFCS